MSTHYAFCEKCDLKILTGKDALAKGVICPNCGDRFSPKKLHRVDKGARELSILSLIAIAIGSALTGASFVSQAGELSAAGGELLGTGLVLFVVAQLLHIRAALEKLNNKE